MAKDTPVKRKSGSKPSSKRSTPVSTPSKKNLNSSVKPASAKKTPASSAKSTPVKKTPVSSAKSTPAKKTPASSAKSTPAKKTPASSAKSTPAKKSSGDSVKSTPSKKKATAASKKQDDSVIPKNRITHAVKELSKYINKKEESSDSNILIDDDELTKSLQLIIVNNESFTGNNKLFKPKLLTVKHSIFKPWKENSATSVKDFKTLLILKDKDISKVTEDDLFDNLDKHGIVVDQIISGQDLKTKYKAFEKRRSLLQDYSLVLADDSIVSTLPKLLGGKSYEKITTTPIPIKTGKKDDFSLVTLTNSIKKVYLERLPVKLPRGTTLNVHLGNLEWFKSEEIAENVLSVAEQFIKDFKIRSVFIKSATSPVLPLYYNQDVLDELVKKSEEQDGESKISTVEIDGVELELSNFDKALMEIANPDQLDKVFAKQVKRAKRKADDSEQLATVKKAKN